MERLAKRLPVDIFRFYRFFKVAALTTVSGERKSIVLEPLVVRNAVAVSTPLTKLNIC